MKKCKLLLILISILLCISPIHAFIEPEFDLESEATVIYNIEHDTIVFSENGDKIMYPASITKMMTALVILQNTINYDEKVTITKDMLNGLAQANASVAGFKLGESVRVKDLLYGLMLPSGADAANALAYYHSFQIDAFVNEMNRVAANLGCVNTHFDNPTGLDSLENYTTANDLVLIMKEALKYDLFKEIISATTYTTEKTKEHPNGITFKSTSLIKDPNFEYYSGYVIGGKTGFTNLAQRTYISYGMTSNGLSYIIVSLKAPFEGYYTPSKCFKDQYQLYNWLDEHFSELTLHHENDFYAKHKITHATKRSFTSSYMEDLTVLVDDEMGIEDFELKAHIYDEYEATIVQDQFIGFITAQRDDDIVAGKASLKANETIRKNTWIIVLEQIVAVLIAFWWQILLIMFILFIVVFIVNLRLREKRRKIAQQKRLKRRLKEIENSNKK